MDSTTRTDYRVEQGVVQKRKVHLCAREDQQAYGIDDTYSLVLKATEVRLITLAIAAEHWCNIYKTDTKQASRFLYGDLEDDEPAR